MNNTNTINAAKTLEEYRANEAVRQNIIRVNAGRRLANGSKSQLPVRAKLGKPMKVQLFQGDEYVGTFDFGVSVEDAEIEAMQAGYSGPFCVKMIPA